MPEALEKEPDGQMLQLAVLMLGLKEPGAHSAHVEEVFRGKKPAAQVSHEVAPVLL